MTLIEVLVATAVLGGMAIILSQIFFSVTHTNTKTELNKEVKQNGEFALEIIERQIRNARKITSACTALGVPDSSITIENPDETSSTVGCVTDNEKTRLAIITSGVTNYLTSPSVTLGGTTCEESSVEMICRTGTDSPSSVEISFGLVQAGIAQTRYEEAQISFQTTVQLRNQ